jgi:hypothetical protein
VAKRLSDSQIRERAIAILMREIGYPDTVRFILECAHNRGDYTQERRKLFKDVSIESLLEEGARMIAEEKLKRRRRSA